MGAARIEQFLDPAGEIVEDLLLLCLGQPFDRLVGRVDRLVLGQHAVSVEARVVDVQAEDDQPTATLRFE